MRRINKNMGNSKEYTWHIANIKDETPQVKSLYLEAVKDRPSFIAGQYLTVKLPHLGPAEGKAYSISSAPHEKHVRLSIKQMGNFSSALFSLSVGDTLITSAPYGFFYPEPEETTPLVFIVGGIGITPCLSIISDLTHKNDSRPLHLFYSNQTETSIAFQSELAILSSQNPHLFVHYFITREVPLNIGHIANRITPAHIQKLFPEAETAEYFLCGSMDFTKSLWKDLREHNIKQHQIYTEGFF